MWKQVERLMAVDALAIERARARVLAAIGQSGTPDDEGGFCRIDSERAWFEASRDGGPVFEGPCQLVATLAEDGAWRWGFDQPTTPREVTHEIRSLVRADAALFEIGLNALQIVDPSFALRLAIWISLRAGFVGVHTVQQDGCTQLFAVGIAARVDPKALWCSACGRVGPEVDAGILRPDAALCIACIRDVRALGEPHPKDPQRVVFEGTLRTPADLVTLRAALASAPRISTGDVDADAMDVPSAPIRSLCLLCGAPRSDVLVLNEAFMICPTCADTCANERPV